VVKIAPSILSADFSKLPDQILSAVDGGADWIHLDVMDGHFVPNITFGPIVVAGVRKLTELTLDVHLMIENADDYLKAFADAGADILTVHYEACPHLWRTIDEIHALGIKAGVTLNPATPIELLDPILSQVELVLIMSVEPGFGGQKFIPASLEKAKYLFNYRKINNLDFDIEIDGGMDPYTGPLAARAGVDVLVAGSSIFNSENIPQAIRELRTAADNAVLIEKSV